jgi:hypothetical protein
MVPVAYFGIESSGLNLVIDLLILFVVVLYLSLVYWTYTDARRRILDPMLVGCATAASLFPFVGTIVYVILRPPEYLEDVHERELEMQAAEARMHELEGGLCPHCDYRIERDFIRCPSCLRKLKERCVSCSRPLDQAWTICPYCETEVPGVVSSRRSRRRRGGPGAAGRSEAGDAVGPATEAMLVEDSLVEEEREEDGVGTAPVTGPEPPSGPLGADRPHTRAGRAGRRRSGS